MLLRGSLKGPRALRGTGLWLFQACPCSKWHLVAKGNIKNSVLINWDPFIRNDKTLWYKTWSKMFCVIPSGSQKVRKSMDIKICNKCMLMHYWFKSTNVKYIYIYILLKSNNLNKINRFKHNIMHKRSSHEDSPMQMTMNHALQMTLWICCLTNN